MTRIILSATLAAALVLAPAAAPAQSDDGPEVLSLLLGIGLFHAIGKGIERARAPATPRPAALPVSDVPGPCAETLAAEGRGLGAACFARRQATEEALQGTSHWYGVDRVRP